MLTLLIPLSLLYFSFAQYENWFFPWQLTFIATILGICCCMYGFHRRAEADRQGQRAATGNGYQFPPIWGPDTYNNGAGMARLLSAAAFIKHNIPFGTTYTSTVLSDGLRPTYAWISRQVMRNARSDGEALLASPAATKPTSIRAVS